MSSIARRLAALGLINDSDVRAWYNAVFVNGGSVSIGRLAIVNTFVRAEKASGAWTLTDDYLVFWAENAAQALTSLKRRVLATAVNSPTFTADRGFTTDGATSYVNTLFAPVTNAVSMTAVSSHFEIYERVELSQNTYAAGVVNSSNRAMTLRPRSATSTFLSSGYAAATFTLPVASSLGLTQAGLNGTLVTDSYGAKNGVDMVRTVNPAAVGATLPVNTIFVGAYSNVGVAAGFRANSYGFTSYGAALTGAQRLDRYNNVQAWATSVGAQV